MLARFWTSLRLRLALFILLSLALHLVVLGLPFFSLTPAAPEVGRIEATLMPLPAPKTSEPPVPVPKPRPTSRPPPSRPAERPAKRADTEPDLKAQPPPAAMPVETSTDGPAMPAVPDAPGGEPAVGPAVESGAGSGTGPDSKPSGTSDSPAAAAGNAPTPARPASPPQSAILYYDGVGRDPRKDPNQRLIGNGTLTWRIEGENHYQADLKATLSFLFISFTVVDSHSEGDIDQGGLEPLRYSETPRNRDALVTLFRRSQDSVGIRGGTIDQVQKGTQDRLSIVFQLGALLRANADLCQPAAQFEVQVANVKGEVSAWSFRSLGLEPVDSGIGRIDAVHVQRILRPGTNERGIDVWIALDLGGYPARILYTEPNAANIDLTLTRIE
jgi:hypothetical protein